MKTKLYLIGGMAALLGLTVHAPVHADDLPLDMGVFTGYHLFSDNNELGAVDAPDAVTVESAFLFGLRGAYSVLPRLALEAEAGLTRASTTPQDTDVGVYVWRLGGRLRLPDITEDTRPFVLVGVGGMTGDSSDESVSLDDTDFVPHAGLGLEQRLWKGLGLRGDVRLLLPPSTATEFVTTDFEFLIGVYYALDQPPEPPPPSDRDGDGIVDEEDGCPDRPEDFDEFEDPDGCPDPDNDGDGVLDGSDECPLEPEDMDGFEDEDGCPDADNDGDGILDGDDGCPDEPEDMDDFEDEDGCPDADNDGDGILDGDDGCPLEPESKNGYEDDDGCPDTVPVKVKRYTGTIPGITFRFRSAEIRTSSHEVLDEAVEVLKEYPAVKLEIQGHTDDVGTEEFNQDLSERRAEAVKDYLVSKGISEDRLTTRGFGESQPVVTNTSKQNRAQNRRVVFLLRQ